MTQAWGLAAQYTLTVLEQHEVQGTQPSANAIDPDDGTIVGDIFPGAAYNQAIQFTPTFQVLSGPVSGAFDVEEGVIVGFVYDDSDQQSGHYPPQAAVWDHGSVRLLERPHPDEPHPHSIATCVNAAGDIWGTAVHTDEWIPPRGPSFRPITPVEWVDGEVLVDLPTLGGAQGSVNTCDDGGNSAGWSLTDEGEQHCTWWTAWGSVYDCHPHHGTSASTGIAMNNRGQLVGNATQYGRSFGYLWQWPGVWWLMPLPGDVSSVVQAVNENGDTVGRSCDDPGGYGHCRAVVWERQRPVDLLPRVLNAGSWTLREAVAVSDEGLIVTHGFNGSSDRFGQVVLLTPLNTPTFAYFAWKARIHNWYVKQYMLGVRHHSR
jgi:hypothetical protein